VALTANSVAGQSELFLQNGFDDFISKPIEVHQFDDVLNRLVRDKHPPGIVAAARQEKANAPSAGEDAQHPTIDPRFAEAFVRDASKTITVLEEIIENKSTCGESDFRAYVIHVHGMKSALANIGEKELSAIAGGLEALGREGGGIPPGTPAFLSALQDVVEKLRQEDEDVAEGDEDRVYLREKLLVIYEACKEYDQSTMDEVLSEVRGKKWSSPTKELLNSIAESLLHSEFDEVADAIGKAL
jgi:HPt (histidine-containing phosphotransfer) domain-containing protein